MLILVDGYNVLKDVFRGDDVSQTDRDQFAAMLNRYARRKKHTITLVFDGGPYGWASREQRGRVSVVFSGSHETADDVIRRMLRAHKGHDVVLISSDLALIESAYRFGFVSVGAADFYRLLKEALSEETAQEMRAPLVKTADNTEQSLDALMQEASKGASVKQEDMVSVVDPDMSGKKLSRVDRKLLDTLKKL